MLELIIILIFVLGYLLIAFEHPIKIDKTAPALLMGMMMWGVFALFGSDYNFTDPHLIETIKNDGWVEFIHNDLMHHMFEISNILFFLLGAMTIVETIDIHDGFSVITNRLTTRKKTKLLWIVAILTFVLSATLDNLTTTIVMISLMLKLIAERKTRLLFAGIIIISANSGGAWSPIGDITTTMLWIGGQISVLPIVVWLIVPSLVCLIIPTAIISFSKDLKGDYTPKPMNTDFKTTKFERTFILILGVSCLIFVPIFKTTTHLPPFMGMLFGVGVLWMVTELMHKKKDYEEKTKLSVIKALTKIDAPSVLFFLGILAAVACLQSMGLLKEVAQVLSDKIGNYEIIVAIIGVFSAIFDNVPLVAACMGMFETSTDPTSIFAVDGKFWQMLAYCAGTGGSMLIIGSAAGVAAMGIEKIDFIWYLKRFALLAFAGYLAGFFTYLTIFHFFG